MAKVFSDTGYFPSIMICDDILIHGRSINHLLDAIELKMVSLLPECDLVTIRTGLAKAVRINVFMVAEGISLLHGRYARNLSLIPATKPEVWRKLSNDISMLILQSGIANAGYIYSLHITKKAAGKIIKEARMVSADVNILGIYMAYILQMMDAGVLAVSSYAPNEKEVDGFMQFAKAGEQSAAIYWHLWI